MYLMVETRNILMMLSIAVYSHVVFRVKYTPSGLDIQET